jgi:ribonuclease Z
VIEAANEAHVLVHDATFGKEEADRALETCHSTAREAAEIARFAGVELLALVHLSSRYGGPEIAEEARGVFENAVVPRDFDVVEVPYPERGGPILLRGGAKPAARNRERDTGSPVP